MFVCNIHFSAKNKVKSDTNDCCQMVPAENSGYIEISPFGLVGLLKFPSTRFPRIVTTDTFHVTNTDTQAYGYKSTKTFILLMFVCNINFSSKNKVELDTNDFRQMVLAENSGYRLPGTRYTGRNERVRIPFCRFSAPKKPK